MQTLPHVSTCLEFTVVDLSTISVFITNLGKYNEGELVDEWLGLALPTTSEHVTQCFEHIGIDGIQYEEFFFN